MQTMWIRFKSRPAALQGAALIALGAVLLSATLGAVSAPTTDVTPALSPAAVISAVERQAQLALAGVAQLVDNLQLLCDLQTLSDSDRPETTPTTSTPATGPALPALHPDPSSQAETPSVPIRGRPL